MNISWPDRSRSSLQKDISFWLSLTVRAQPATLSTSSAKDSTWILTPEKGANHPATAQAKAANSTLISTDVVNYLKEELLQTWETYLVPDYHRTVFLDCIQSPPTSKYSPIIAKEIEELQT